MFESFRRLFPSRVEAHDPQAVAEWARRHGHVFKRARNDDGFVIEGALDGLPWRIEWGPPQRAYLTGRELRLRMDAGLPSELQMLLLSRTLMDALERRTFEEFTDTLQTQVGTGTPEEMRWLVMFPKVELAELGALLRVHFGAVASTPAAATAWLGGPLGALLDEAVGAPAGLLHDDPPFVLMTLRGRVYLRLQIEAPEPDDVAAALALFEAAVARTQQAAAAAARRGRDGRGHADDPGKVRSGR